MMGELCIMWFIIAGFSYVIGAIFLVRIKPEQKLIQNGYMNANTQTPTQISETNRPVNEIKTETVRYTRPSNSFPSVIRLSDGKRMDVRAVTATADPKYTCYSEDNTYEGLYSKSELKFLEQPQDKSHNISDIVKCPECGIEVPALAHKCPNCGCPL